MELTSASSSDCEFCKVKCNKFWLDAFFFFLKSAAMTLTGTKFRFPTKIGAFQHSKNWIRIIYFSSPGAVGGAAAAVPSSSSSSRARRRAIVLPGGAAGGKADKAIEVRLLSRANGGTNRLFSEQASSWSNGARVQDASGVAACSGDHQDEASGGAFQ